MAHHEEEGHGSLAHMLFKFELLQYLLRPQVLLIVATIALFGTSLWRQKTGQLTGEVYDRADHEPAADVRVLMEDQSGNPLGQTQTDEAGVFIFPILENTGYRLKLEKPGYETREVVDSATMNSSSSVILRIPLRRVE